MSGLKQFDTIAEGSKSISKRVFKFYSSNFNLLTDVANKCIEKYNLLQKTHQIRIN